MDEERYLLIELIEAQLGSLKVSYVTVLYSFQIPRKPIRQDIQILVLYRSRK